MFEETIAFQKIPTKGQNRFADRMSYVHLNRVKIVQSDSGVVAYSDDLEGGSATIDIPVASLAVLSLGFGASITNAALTSCARSGCVVLFTGGSGYPLHTIAAPLTSSSQFAMAQARVVANHTEAKKVAKIFYKKQFGVDSFEGSISQMRGMEGTLMRKTYALHAKKARLVGWRKDTQGTDSVNIALNIANNALYGVSASAVSALSMNAALGVIHRGHVRSFLFDLADLYKATISIPLAFSLSKENPTDVPDLARKAVRKAIFKENVLLDLFGFLTSTFAEYADDTDLMLIGQNGDVEAHKNYGSDVVL